MHRLNNDACKQWQFNGYLRWNKISLVFKHVFEMLRYYFETYLFYSNFARTNFAYWKMGFNV